jgi:hypothetical protein
VDDLCPDRGGKKRKKKKKKKSTDHSSLHADLIPIPRL